MIKISAVGSVGLDTVTTPSGRREEILGGSVVHFAVSASFQTSVGLVGVVGDDFPTEHTDFLKSRNVDLEGLEIVPGKKTFRWEGSYLNDLNAADTHCTALNVFADFEPKLPDNYKNAPLLFLANIHPELQLHVIDEMPESCYRICDTMNLWINETREKLEEVLRKVNIIILNDGEAKMLTGEENLILAGKKMLDYGVEYCIIKKGEHGAKAFGKNNFFAVVPAYPIEVVVDPTGAGDSFAGGFVGYIAKTADTSQYAIRQALRWGTVMGSFNVADFSCDKFRSITSDDVKKRLEEFNEMIS